MSLTVRIDNLLVKKKGIAMSEFNYLEERNRMLNSIGRASGKCIGVNCEDCPFNVSSHKYKLSCSDFESECTKEAIDLVKKWSEDNPIEKENISENQKAIKFFKIRLEENVYLLTDEQKKAFSSALAALERIERGDALYDKFVEFLKDTRGINDVRND